MSRLKNSIKMDLEEIGCKMWTAFTGFRTGFKGGISLRLPQKQTISLPAEQYHISRTNFGLTVTVFCTRNNHEEVHPSCITRAISCHSATQMFNVKVTNRPVLLHTSSNTFSKRNFKLYDTALLWQRPAETQRGMISFVPLSLTPFLIS